MRIGRLMIKVFECRPRCGRSERPTHAGPRIGRRDSRVAGPARFRIRIIGRGCAEQRKQRRDAQDFHVHIVACRITIALSAGRFHYPCGPEATGPSQSRIGNRTLIMPECDRWIYSCSTSRWNHRRDPDDQSKSCQHRNECQRIHAADPGDHLLRQASRAHRQHYAQREPSGYPQQRSLQNGPQHLSDAGAERHRIPISRVRRATVKCSTP